MAKHRAPPLCVLSVFATGLGPGQKRSGPRENFPVSGHDALRCCGDGLLGLAVLSVINKPALSLTERGWRHENGMEAILLRSARDAPGGGADRIQRTDQEAQHPSTSCGPTDQSKMARSH